MTIGGFTLDFAQVATLLVALATLAGQVHSKVTGKGPVKAIETIEAQVTPNGGSSMRDAIGRIEALVTDLATRVAVLEQARRPFWRR